MGKPQAPKGSETSRDVSRRSLLATGWRAVAAANLIGMQKFALAASGGRSVVCLYLLGGSDGNSLIAPLNSGEYDAYAASRGELAIPMDRLLPVQTRTGGTPFGLHPALGELQQLFNRGSLAMVANVGSQTRVSPKGSGAKGASPEARYRSLTFIAGGYATLNWAASKAGIEELDRDRAFTFPGGVTMLSLGGSTGEEPRQRNPELIRFAESATARMSFPDTLLGRQLRLVAGLLQRGESNGAGDVYFVPVPVRGADVQEAARIGAPLRDLSQSLAAFYDATLSLALDQRVVTFTDSEFGRAMSPNRKHGSNPGWGNHQMVLGGAVKGGEIYGAFPGISAAALDSDGSLIPTTSPERYHGTLARWLGLSDGEVATLLPGLTHDGAWRLGFLG